MGTRGFVGFVVDGVEKLAYNHWDSYPSGVGLDTLSWLREVVAESEGLQRELAKALSTVPDRQPTGEELRALSEFLDTSVGGPDDAWYQLLRGTQGKAGAILRAGYYEDAGDFPLDSLWCEWGYLIDFDTRVLEVYKGFRQTPPTEGRWVGKRGDGDYEPVQRVATFAFDALPSGEEFCALESDED